MVSYILATSKSSNLEIKGLPYEKEEESRIWCFARKLGVLKPGSKNNKIKEIIQFKI